MLAGRPTLLMSREIYATPILIGCALFVALRPMTPYASAIGFAAVFRSARARYLSASRDAGMAHPPDPLKAISEPAVPHANTCSSWSARNLGGRHPACGVHRERAPCRQWSYATSIVTIMFGRARVLDKRCGSLGRPCDGFHPRRSSRRPGARSPDKFKQLSSCAIRENLVIRVFF